MDESGTLEDDKIHLCKICNEKQRQYTCPQCGINYCSLDCYKSINHQDCSEFFYKSWVEKEIQLRNYDPENKKKMLEILNRLKNDSEEPSIIDNILNDEEDSDDLDSDDEVNVSSIEERLANIDLDNADELWSVLTDAERQEFEAIIQSNDINQILPDWTPWWEQIVEKKLVRELNEIPQYEKFCPTLVVVPEIKGQMKASPCVQFNLINVVYSYAYIVLHFFGDHQNSAKLSTQIFLYICENMSKKTVFKDVDSATSAVFKRIFEGSNLMETEESGTILSIKEAGDKIIHGPEENCCYYVLAALSDLHALLTKAKVKISSESAPVKTQFYRKFQEYKNLDSIDVSKKSIQLYLKKLEFYMSWVNLYGKNLCGSELNLQELET